MALFIGKLSPAVDRKKLEQLLLEKGKLKRFDAARPNMAFVTYEEMSGAEACLRDLQDFEIAPGVKMSIEWTVESGRTAENRPRDNGNKPPLICYTCAGQGHLSRNCPKSSNNFMPRDYRRDDRDGRRDYYRRDSRERERERERDRDRDRDRRRERSRSRSPRRRSRSRDRATSSSRRERSPLRRDRSVERASSSRRDRTPPRRERSDEERRSSRDRERSPRRDRSPRRRSPSPRRRSPSPRRRSPSPRRNGRSRERSPLPARERSRSPKRADDRDRR